MTAARAPQRFGAVIVNYAAAPLSLDAALSFLGDGGARAVIVDNQSPDGSRAYFQRALASSSHYATPPQEPVDGADVEFAALGELETDYVREDGRNGGGRGGARLTVVESPRNGGFAAGCNIGLQLLQSDPSIDAFLLLNPDALLAKGGLGAFAARLIDETAGLCGASVLGFEPPHPVQAFGGATTDRLHRGFNIGEGASWADRPPQDVVEATLAYPLGAAMACRRDYLDIAGLLDERYFLYFEEIDWTLSGAPSRRPVWAPDAVVYHRYGGSSGSAKTGAREPSNRSPLSDFHMTRSRILFAQKWRPATAPIARLAGGFQAATRLARGRAANAKAVARAAIDPSQAS